MADQPAQPSGAGEVSTKGQVPRPDARLPAPVAIEGTLLSGEQLLDHLTSERIFVKGSWIPKRIKGAGYELTLAADWVAAPQAPGSSQTVIATPRGGGPIQKIVLAPGDTAIIASHERFCLDFDISAAIGPKFRWAALGLQVLHGSTAHPGYGRTLTSSGWEKKKDERLYVVVVNIGPDTITLRAGDPILYVQFFKVSTIVPREPIENIGFDILTNRFMQDETGSVLYYRALSDLRSGFRQFKTTAEAQQDKLSGRLDVIEALVNRTSSAVELVVVFGVFLVTVTILGVVYVSIVDAVKSIPDTASDSQLTLVRWLTVIFGILVGGVLVAVVAAIMRAIGRRPSPNRGSHSDPKEENK